VTSRRCAADQALVDVLTLFANDDELVGAAWVTAVASAFIANPAATVLDDWYYAALLEIAGFELCLPEHILLAADLTAYLQGTGCVTLVCSHADQPTPLCELVAEGRPMAFAHGAADLASGVHAPLLDARAQIQREIDEEERRMADARLGSSSQGNGGHCPDVAEAA